MASHLSGCAGCRETLERMRTAASALDRWTLSPAKTPAIGTETPSTGGRPRRAGRRLPRRPSRSSAPLIWGIAAAAALLVGITILLSLPPDGPSLQDPKSPSTAGAERVEVPPPPPKATVPEPAPERRPPAPPEKPKAEPSPKEERGTPTRPSPDDRGTPERKKPADPREPENPKVPAPKRPRPTRVVVASLEDTRGEVRVVTPNDRSPVRAPHALFDGEGLQTGGSGGRAVVTFSDGTRLVLGAGTTIREISGRSARKGVGKWIDLERGELTAEVAEQPAERPLVFSCPQGEATVLGTTLKLRVTPGPKGSTRLEVSEGKVRLKRLTDGRSVDVAGGHFAVAASGLPLTAKLLPHILLLDDFADSRRVLSRWTPLAGGFPTRIAGRIEIDVSPRSGDPYTYATNWHVPGGAQTRRAFALPLRVTVDVEIARKHMNLNGSVSFVPPGGQPGAPDVLWVRLREDTLQLRVGPTRNLGTLVVPGEWPRKERWTVEVDRTEMRLLVNGKATLAGKHGVAVSPNVHIRLEANAKADVPRGTWVRFDNVRVEKIEP